MVGDDTQRAIVQILATGQFGGGFDKAAEQVDLVIAMHLLHDGGKAFQPHAGVNGRLRQRRQCPVGRTVILHKHQIPDFDVTVTLFVGGTGWATFNFRPMVIKNLAARAARAGVAHRPEIILSADPAKPCRVDAHFL